MAALANEDASQNAATPIVIFTIGVFRAFFLFPSPRALLRVAGREMTHCLLPRLRLQRGEIGLAAERHHRHLAGAEIRPHDLHLAVAWTLPSLAWEAEMQRHVGLRPDNG